MDAAGRKRAAPEGANGAGGPKRARGERLPDLSLSLDLVVVLRKVPLGRACSS
jgi:hypothetical protein